MNVPHDENQDYCIHRHRSPEGNAEVVVPGRQVRADHAVCCQKKHEECRKESGAMPEHDHEGEIADRKEDKERFHLKIDDESHREKQKDQREIPMLNKFVPARQVCRWLKGAVD